jgi:hypothetical protein
MKMVVLRGGTRGLMMKQANNMKGTMMKATMRMDQPKDREELLSSLDKTMGKMTPPTEDPDATIPRAAARRLSK